MSESAPTIEQLQQQLAEKQQVIAGMERRQKIDEMLRQADVVDLEAVRLLTEAAIARMDEPNLEAAIAELRAKKPALFGTTRAKAAAQAPRRDPAARVQTARDAAVEAEATGKRADLLRYLRLKRGA